MQAVDNSFADLRAALGAGTLTEDHGLRFQEHMDALAALVDRWHPEYSGFDHRDALQLQARFDQLTANWRDFRAALRERVRQIQTRMEQEEIMDQCLNDGLTHHGYIAAAPGLYPAMRFQYRPTLISERRALWTEQERRGDKDAPVMELLARKIQSWDVKDSKGVTANCKDAKVFAQLKPRLYDRLFAIVAGLEPGDPDPLRPEEPAAVFDEAEAEKN